MDIVLYHKLAGTGSVLVLMCPMYLMSKPILAQPNQQQIQQQIFVICAVEVTE